jgi:hypothetical protein
VGTTGAWGPCSSMSVVIGQLKSSPIYGHWLGIGCERLLEVTEAVFLEWLPMAVILALAGALASRLSVDVSRLRGSLTSGALAAIAFFLFTLDRSAWFFGAPNVPRAVGVGAGALAIGLLLGYVGSVCAGRTSPTKPSQRTPER